MLKSITQKDNTVICLKLRDNLFTLAQVRHRWFMQFFDLTSPREEFHGMDLNRIDPLFCIIVAEKPLLPLMVKKISIDRVIPNSRDIPKKMFSAIIESKGLYGANLIELTENYSSYGNHREG